MYNDVYFYTLNSDLVWVLVIIIKLLLVNYARECILEELIGRATKTVILLCKMELSKKNITVACTEHNFTSFIKIK